MQNKNYSDSTGVLTSNGHPIWAQGFLLRKLPGKDALLPVQIWFDPQSGLICQDTIPPEFREELSNFSFIPGQTQQQEDWSQNTNPDIISWNDDTAENPAQEGDNTIQWGD